MPNASVLAAATGLPSLDPDRQLLRKLRLTIAARIARDIALLDAIDGDPDFEPEPREDQHDAEDTGRRMGGAFA